MNANKKVTVNFGLLATSKSAVDTSPWRA